MLDDKLNPIIIEQKAMSSKIDGMKVYLNQASSELKSVQDNLSYTKDLLVILNKKYEEYKKGTNPVRIEITISDNKHGGTAVFDDKNEAIQYINSFE